MHYSNFAGCNFWKFKIFQTDSSLSDLFSIIIHLRFRGKVFKCIWMKCETYPLLLSMVCTADCFQGGLCTIWNHKQQLWTCYNARDAVLVFESIHRLTPYYLSEKFKRNSEVHSQVTRNVNDLHLPLCRLVTEQRTFDFRGAKMWNSLPPEIKSEQSLKSFKYKLHSHLLAF
jgi:hypothetical protein